MPIVIKLIDEALREKLQCGLQAMTPNIRSRATLSSANVAVLAKQNLLRIRDEIAWIALPRSSRRPDGP
jgi:hypothetical protein